MQIKITDNTESVRNIFSLILLQNQTFSGFLYLALEPKSEISYGKTESSEKHIGNFSQSSKST